MSLTSALSMKIAILHGKFLWHCFDLFCKREFFLPHDVCNFRMTFAQFKTIMLPERVQLVMFYAVSVSSWKRKKKDDEEDEENETALRERSFASVSKLNQK